MVIGNITLGSIVFIAEVFIAMLMVSGTSLFV